VQLVANPADFKILTIFLGAYVASFRQVLEHVRQAHATGLLVNTGRGFNAFFALLGRPHFAAIFWIDAFLSGFSLASIAVESLEL